VPFFVSIGVNIALLLNKFETTKWILPRWL